MRGLIAIIIVAGCGDDGGGGGGGGDAAHEACITETNMYRATVGKPPVVHSPDLEAYADEGAMFDFSASPHDHFRTTNGGGIAFAENECPQQGNWRLQPGGDMTALVKQCIAAFWSEGPGGGHYDNMVGNYGTLGCGIYQEDTRVTIIQDFGR